MREEDVSETVLRNKVKEMRVLIDGLSTNNIHMERQLSQIQEFMEKLMQEQAQLQILHEELQDSRNQIQFLEKELKDNKHQLERLREELLKKTAYIAGIQSGIGWRMLVYYRKNIKNRLAPVGTKRRILYDELLNWIKFKKKNA